MQHLISVKTFIEANLYYEYSTTDYDDYGVKISNTAASVCGADLEGHLDGEYNGDFWLESYKEGSHEYYAYYLYSSADTNVTCDYTDPEEEDVLKVDLKLKKGWNLVYELTDYNADHETYTLTTTAKSGLNWVFSR